MPACAPIRTEPSQTAPMNQNVLILLIVLVAANLVVVAVVVARSLIQRRGYRLDEARRDAEAAHAPTPPRGYMSPMPRVDAPAQPTRTDELTGLLILGEWNRIIADEDARTHRYGRPATVVIIELEGLDRLAAALGPDAAERVLPALADALSRNARGADHLARLGPSRFGVLLPETGEVEAVNYVERVRAACEMWLDSGAIALRLAIGWASPTSDSTLSDALGLAIERMYGELHRNGRRAAELALDEPTPLHDVGGSPFRA